MLRVFALGLVLATGCALDAGSEDEKAAPVCEAGKVSACPCDDGDNGTQTCKSDGSAWGACACSMLSPQESDPGVACQQEQTDQSVYAPQERCQGERPRMFLACGSDIAASGVCTRTTFGTFCCPAG